jgi:hypothetical protein
MRFIFFRVFLWAALKMVTEGDGNFLACSGAGFGGDLPVVPASISAAETERVQAFRAVLECNAAIARENARLFTQTFSAPVSVQVVQDQVSVGPR